MIKEDRKLRYKSVLALWFALFGILIMASVIGFDIVNVYHEGINLIGNYSGVVREDVNFLVNMSINISNYTLSTGATNITNISITLPSGFSYLNFTFAMNISENYTVTNTSGVIIVNATLNGTALAVNKTVVYLWFLINASGPGNYNMTVSTFNGSGIGVASLLNVTSISFVVNDTIIPNNITFVSPVNGTYLSGDSIFFNASIYDNGAIQGIFSTLGWANSSGAINRTNLTTISNISQEARLQYNYSNNFTGLIDGVYVLNVTVNDTFNNLNSTSHSRIVTLDRTYPLPSYGTGTESTNGYTNRSFIIANVSVVETNFNFTNLTLYNLSGFVIRSNLTWTNAGALYINFTSLSQGVYVFNATVNDSAGNVNYTLGSRNITLDWTAPSVSHSCGSSLTVTKNSNLSCTCTATDTVDANPNVAYTVNPSTVNTGTFTTTCTAKDMTNNSAADTITYTVEQGGSGSSSVGSSTGASNAKTINVDNRAFEAGYTSNLKANEKMRVNVPVRNSKGDLSGGNESHTLTLISLNFTDKSTIIEVASAPVRATLKVGETKKFEVTGDNYYDLQATLNSVGPVLANITIKAVYELVPLGERKETPVKPQKNQTASNESAGNGTKVLEESGSAAGGIWWVVVIAIILIIVGIGYYIYMSRKKVKNQ